MGRGVSEQLLRALKKIDRPGSFCVSGGGPAPLPGLEVAGLGPIGLPLTGAPANELKKHCRQAPYGKGERTVVDTNVRRVWEMDPDRFSLTNPDWQVYLSETVRTVQRELGLDGERLQSHLYNLLLYEPGSFFLPHRDGEKLDRMVATLVVVLPSSFRGGELVVRHEGQERVVDFGVPDRNPLHTQFVAFYPDCEHEVRPLQAGHRLCLVYNLTLARSKKAITAPRTAGHADEIATILRAWSDTDPPKLAVPLEHGYTQDGLNWDALKGVDRARAGVLRDAADRAGCKAYLALLTLQESGSAEEFYEPRGRRRRYSEDEDEDEDEDDPGDYEMGEIFESSLTAEHWSDAEGNRLPLGPMEVEREEIVPPDALTKVKPEEDVEGYTGNEGLTMTRWYRHAAVFLWPDAHHFDVMCDCGIGSAAAALGELVSRWQKASRSDAAGLKTQCTAFADTIIGRWSGTGGTHAPETSAPLMASLVRLDDARLIGRFLAEVVARDPSVEPDDAIIKACDTHGWAAFQKELVAVFEGTTVGSLGRNARLLERLGSTRSRPKGERLGLCQLLAEMLVSALETIDRQDVSTDWRLRAVKRPELLAGLARVLITTEQHELLSRVVTHTLSAPNTYPLLAHVSAMTGLRPWLKTHLKKPSAAVSQWLAACCEQLELLTTQEPVRPADFRRDANLSCQCADCSELRAFLKDPVEKVYRFRVRQDRRQHLEHTTRWQRCDVTCVTERVGSPQTLVCTKTTASYEAKLKTYREDREHLATLRSIRLDLPE